jgi:cyclic pyranopterin phosphate synthase
MRQDPRLIDSHGRVLRDLRVSLTDRCNFRLQSLTPSAGVPTLPDSPSGANEARPGLWSD